MVFVVSYPIDAMAAFAQRWFEAGNELNALIFGESGIGKSTLTNGLLRLPAGKQLAKESKWEVGTKKIEQFKYDIDGVKVKIYDTPGRCACAARVVRGIWRYRY